MVFNASNASLVFYSDQFIEINILSIGRALDSRESIDSFVLHYKDIRHCELSDNEWEAITLVTSV